MIEDYAKETIDWSFFFMDIGFNKDNAPQDICEDIDFLINRFNFEYSDNLYQKNPFVPMAYFKNIGRSVDVSDLTADDIARLKTVLTKTENPILQGKIYDVLGIVENTKANSIKAADIYVEYAINKEIAELIGEDLTLTIEYLACRKLSGNLRNEYYHHGHGDTNKFSLDEASLFYFLIKAYCMGYDETINANIWNKILKGVHFNE